MSEIGVPYRVMYLSRRAVSGLTNVVAWVLRPDKTVAGYFPLEEAPAPFTGCYFFDYLTGSQDQEGEYFSKVMSPSEARVDVVRFSLYKDGGGANVVQSTQAADLVGFISSDPIVGSVNDSEDVWSYVDASDIRGLTRDDETIVGEVSEVEVSGNTGATSPPLEGLT